MHLRLPTRAFVAALFFWCATVSVAGQSPQGAAIASAHPLATAAGYEVMRAGGNAFDAAVAVAAALGVVEPYSSGLGGGGFFLLHRTSDRRQVFIDGREVAPAAARPEQYLNEDGTPRAGATTRGGTAVGIPGLPAALVHVASRYGRLPLAASLAPAVALARGGFPADGRYVRIAQLREDTLRRHPAAAAIYLHEDAAPERGALVRQADLARTLERLAREGAEGFYRGEIAQALVAAVNAAGGAWSSTDLAGYRVVERSPLAFRFRGARVVTAPLPSAGGIAVGQALAMLESYAVGDPLEPRNAHLVVEALRRAFQDRVRHLGDSDHAEVPVARLLDPDYLRARARDISTVHATPSAALQEQAPARVESGNTTHLSVVDPAGNRVAATLSINWLFGSAIVAPGTGVLLNNEMDDFTVQEGVANTYRLRGSEANAIAPGKRPLSSMTPTFVEDARGVLVIGAPGGSRIVSQVLLAILQHLAAPRVDLPALVAAPRYHHQFLPDRVEIEPDSFAGPWREALRSYGHRLEPGRRKWGNLQAVFQSWERNGEVPRAYAASDPRGSDVAWY